MVDGMSSGDTAAACRMHVGPMRTRPGQSPDDGSQDGRMGTLADMNNTVMYPFGSQGFVRPIAGMQRRCLDQDDLDALCPYLAHLLCEL